MMISKILRVVVIAAAAVGVSAHADRTPQEMAEYHRHVARDSEALSQCLDSPELKELNARVVAERQASFRRLRKARSIGVQSRGKSALEFEQVCYKH